MKTYLVFEPQAGNRTPAEAERVVFLREKFSWPAFFFGPLWLAWHRLWLALAFWLAAVVLIAAAVAVWSLDASFAAIAGLVPSFVLAFEATAVRRQKLLANGFRDVGVVVADHIEAAERRFFDRWLRETPKREPAFSPPPSSLPPLAVPPKVIGFFPDPGTIR